MKKLFLILLSALAIVACGEKDVEAKTEQPTSKVPTKADFASYVDKGVEYDVSPKGVLIFAKARDMFADFNDYQEEEGEVKFLSEKPLSILITKHLTEGEKHLSKEYGEMSFLYAIYRTFMNTPENEVTVETYPIIITAKNKKLPQKAFTLKATVTREKALEVLKKYTDATTIEDLVQTEENNEYRMIGTSGSKIWDKFIYNEKERSNIVADLVK